MKMKSFITLFIVGIIGVVFCEVDDLTDVTNCVRDIFVELNSYSDGLFMKLSTDDFLKALHERFYYWEIDDFPVQSLTHNLIPTGYNAMMKMYENCKNDQILIDRLIVKGEELIREDKSYKPYADYFIYRGGFTLFMRMLLGLFKKSGHIKETSELFEHRFASGILVHSLNVEQSMGKYCGHVPMLMAYISYDVGIFTTVISPLSDHDPRTKLVEEFCKNLLEGRNEHNNEGTSKDSDKETALQQKSFQSLREKMLFDPKNIFNKYVQKGKNRKSWKPVILSTDNELFVYGLCDTSSWVNFKNLKNEVTKYDRFDCIRTNASNFVRKVKKFVTADTNTHLFGDCVEKEMFSIEEITSFGIETYLKEFDKRYLDHILNIIRNGDPEDTETKIKNERKTFIELYNNYKIGLKWSCMTEDKDDIPFHDWVETRSILYMPSERIMSYLEEFANGDAKNDEIDELYQKITEKIGKDLK